MLCYLKNPNALKIIVTNLAERLDEPGALHVVAVGHEAGDGGVGHHHVLKGGVPHQGHLHPGQEVGQRDALNKKERN